MSIIEIVRNIALQYPNRIALRSAKGEVSYSEFVRRFGGLACALQERRIGPHKRVAIYIDRSAEMIIGLFGVLACGAAYIPLNTGDPVPRLRSIVEDSEPSILLGGSEATPLLEPFGIERLDPAAWPHEGPCSRVTDLCSRAINDAPAYLIYTSGSTGKPKGVVIGHVSLENYLSWAIAELPFSGGGVPLFSSVSFDHSVTVIFPPLMKGEQLHLLPSIEQGRSLAQHLLTGHRYSYVKITPSHFRLLDADERARLGRSVDLLMFGGERLPSEFIRDVRRDNRNLAVMNHYGPTETTVGCCVYRVPTEFSGVIVPIGLPIPGAIASIRGPDFTFMKDGECGELMIGGRGLALQYWHQPDHTKQAFIELPDVNGELRSWYRTGDLVRCLPNGMLEYLGRNDQQIKILGHRVEPAEIEAVLAAHPQVRQAVVFPADSIGLPLMGAVTLSESGTTESQLQQYLRSRLPTAMIPTRILVLQSLPITTNGKIDCECLLAGACQDATSSEAPLEDRLAAKFREALGVNSIGMNDDFFELGGDSRAAVEIAMWVSEYLQVYLEAAVFFKYPTVSSLAARIRSLLAETSQGMR